MGEKSKISWTDHTFNMAWGCANVSPGCDRCYAESFSNRLAMNIWGKDSPRRFFGEKHWNEPLRWNVKAVKEGKRMRVFCGSMCDLLEEWKGDPIGDVSPLKEWGADVHGWMGAARRKLWDLIERTPKLDWLLLTKRPQNYLRMLPGRWINDPLRNVWIMTTVESPEYLWRLDAILRVPAIVHGVSWEPALADINLAKYRFIAPNLWVIAGGESGAGCRPFDLEWARKVRDGCREMGMKFFMKQLGGHPNKRDDPMGWPEDLRVQEFPNGG